MDHGCLGSCFCSGPGGDVALIKQRTIRPWPSNAFMNIAPELADPDRARFAILPLAYDATASYKKGCRFGPDAIIEASEQLEWFDERLGHEFIDAGVYTCPHVVDPSTKPSPEQVQQLVFDAAATLFERDKVVIGLGGEHAVSAALIRAAQLRYADLTVLHFDAHADLRDSYEGSEFSHACVMRRVFDLQVPFISVGIRSYCRDQFELMQSEGIAPITPEQIRADLNGAIDRILQTLNGPVYVTLDIDALDPAQAPGTGTPEPGGLDYLEVVRILEAVGRARCIVGGDIVEVIPLPDNHITEFTAARLAFKLIACACLSD